MEYIVEKGPHQNAEHIAHSKTKVFNVDKMGRNIMMKKHYGGEEENWSLSYSLLKLRNVFLAVNLQHFQQIKLSLFMKEPDLLRDAIKVESKNLSMTHFTLPGPILPQINPSH